MPSPFPGMDPYLEDPAFWPDFHSRFINYWCEAVADRLPDGYEARIDERVSLVQRPPTPRARPVRPDVAVTRAPQGSPAGSAGTAAVATLEIAPVVLPNVQEEDTRETFIRVLHRPDRTLVAVLELLSPSNKEEPGRSEYLAKRRALLAQDVHLVEVDLLLGGRRLPLGADYPPGDYFALVSRADRRPLCDVFAWPLAHRLPVVPVPLAGGDPDVLVPLGEVSAVTYERGRYARAVDYGRPPAASLGEEQRRWAAEQVRAAARP